METETEGKPAEPAKKAPRKPRPSEIAAKKAKPAKRSKVAKSKRKPVKKSKARKPAAGATRTERLDLRLTKAEKARITGKATKLRRTVTSIVIEAIEKIK